MARTWLQIRVDLLGMEGADLTHPPEFELADGSRIGFSDDELAPEEACEDHATAKVAQAVGPGEGFDFTFDFGDRWLHRCRALPEKLDPREGYGPGPLPKQPVPMWGWGSIPDQYGRETAEELDLDG